MKLQQGGIVVTDGPTPFVRPPHFNLGGRIETKNCIYARRDKEDSGSSHEAVHVTKTLAPLPGRLEDPGLVVRDGGGARPARWLATSFSPEVPSFILSVA